MSRRPSTKHKQSSKLATLTHRKVKDEEKQVCTGRLLIDNDELTPHPPTSSSIRLLHNAKIRINVFVNNSLLDSRCTFTPRINFTRSLNKQAIDDPSIN